MSHDGHWIISLDYSDWSDHLYGRSPVDEKSSVTDRPLLLLKERYVKGEINEEEYQLKRKVLNEK